MNALGRLQRRRGADFDLVFSFLGMRSLALDPTFPAPVDGVCVGEKLRITSPSPESAIELGLPPPSWPTCNTAERAKIPEGENTTLILQLAPPASVAGGTGQLLPGINSPALAPVTATCHKCTGVEPMFVSVTASGALDDPTTIVGKVRLAGCTPSATPIPVRSTL